MKIWPNYGRIIFTIVISNTDDHLRNHGFLYERYRGWRLSPTYDMSPTSLEIKVHVLTTAIDFDDNTASLETAMSVAKDFRLFKEQVSNIINEVVAVVQQWRQCAIVVGL
jgi:serine/threonine-protein kinase HipA